MAKARDIRRNAVTAVLAAVFLLGACLLAYPTASDWWNQMHASRAVADYAQAAEDLSSDDLEALLAEAREYNERLAQGSQSYELSGSELARYEAQLAVPSTSAVAALSIPSIGVELPVYRGTSEGALQVGAGHLAGSSLPVGGPSTHAVLVGHRGLPSARLLTDLDRLAVGDSFSVACLGEVMYYEVDQVLVVEPSDVSALAIEEGEDLCTLVTCTPYGVNTHRLLVRGHRVEAPGLSDYVTSDAVRVSSVLVACVIAVPILVVLVVAVLAAGHRRRSRCQSGAAFERRRRRIGS